MVRSFPLNRIKNPFLRAEVAAVGWEVFSALLFASAVIPAALGLHSTALLFLTSMVVSGVLARALLAQGERAFLVLAIVRVLSWPLSILPLLAGSGLGALVAALAFGLMAGSMRGALYRRVLDDTQPVEDD